MLGLFDIFWINNEEFLPASVIRDRDAHDVIFVAGFIDPSYGEHFDLHPLQFFKPQVFKQRASGRGQIVLHWIGEREEIASGVSQSVAQCDQFFPAINRDQPAVFKTAFKLFGFDAKMSAQTNGWNGSTSATVDSSASRR